MFAFSGEAKNKKYALEIILECHEAWKRLVAGQSGSTDVKMCVPTLYMNALLMYQTAKTRLSNLPQQRLPHLTYQKTLLNQLLPLTLRSPSGSTSLVIR